MNKADCFYLGYVAKLHGYKGEVSLFLDTTNPENYAQLSSVFIEINGELIPFFVQKIQLNAKGFAKVKFEDVDTEEDARKIHKKELFLSLELLPQLSDKNFYDHEIIDFEVIEDQFGNIGKVQQVIDHPTNPLLQVFNTEKNKELLFPLGNHLIQKVDRENKMLYIKSIPGIVELYLED